MISAGAACVGIGSAVVYRGENAVALIRDELSQWLKDHGYDCLDRIRGRTRCADRPGADRTGKERPRKDRTGKESNPPPVPTWEARRG